MIKRLLIANRGEIACRIIGTAKQSGITCCAIYSTPDEHAQHVLLSDEAYPLGGTSATESYLKKYLIIKIALENNIDAIHPGYGFLSENADFAQAVCAAGIIFIGPQAELIELMGEKDRAKATAIESGLPVAADHLCALPLDMETIIAEARKIGYPLLAKATAGGGGKGMRLITESDALIDSIQAASREAENSFGNPSVFLEKYIQPARHIEVQIAADQHGQVIHLFTRECSIQRRHQKVIEEAPAPIAADISTAICESACQLVKHIGYIGLGTLEFLLGPDGCYYFMEMNTRLQVEHPVTEWITSLDCVALQFAIAEGKHLPKQSSIANTGHAIEARICAEQPLQDFMPSSGPLTYFSYPKNTKNTRIDTGFITGDQISPYYDSMIAKAIAFGNNRADAAATLTDLLKNTEIIGIHSNLAFLTSLIETDAFQSETLSTDFIPKHFDQLKEALTNIPLRARATAISCFLMIPTKHQAESDDKHSPWALPDCFRLTGFNTHTADLTINDQAVSISASRTSSGFKIITDGEKLMIGITLMADRQFQINFDGKQSIHHWELSNNILYLSIDGRLYTISRRTHNTINQETNSNQSKLSSPMPGTITQVMVLLNERVKAGQTLLCLEAMKMEHAIKAPKDGTITEIFAHVGESTQAGQILIVMSFESS